MPAPATTDQPGAAPDRCVLEHRVFSCFGDVLFRPAEGDGAPVMIVPMGGGHAAVPLGALQQEFGIRPGSPDGRTLALVAQALDFVAELRPGEPLPLEVLGGGASWQPGAAHQRVAEARLRLQLVGAFSPLPAPPWVSASTQAVLSAAAEPGLDARVHAACIEAAAALAVPPPAVPRLLAAASHEMGFVEALRDRLLRRVGVMVARVAALGGTMGHNLAAMELLSRVRRLAVIAQARIRARFTELEAQMAEVVEALRDLDARNQVIRMHRDWLYSSLRAWEGVLLAWETGGIGRSDGTVALLQRTYRFLAPRFMPTQEWRAGLQAYRADAAPRVPMVW